MKVLNVFLFLVLSSCGSASVVVSGDAIDSPESDCVSECAPEERHCLPDDRFQYCEEVEKGCFRWHEQACHPAKYCEDGICKLHCDLECPTGSCDDNCNSENPDMICNDEGKCVIP